jgi:hypothetical protein
VKRTLLVVLAATVALGASAAFAATLSVSSAHLWVGSQSLTKGTCSVNASVDTYVDQNNPTSSFGSASTMSVQPDTNKVRHALVVFDLSSCNVPATGGADSATLQLRVTTAPKNSRTLTLTRVTSPWSGSTTWNTSPSVAGAATTTFASGVTNNTTVSVPVTIDADAFLKDSVSNLGWLISDGGSAVAQDTTTFAVAPTLVINYEK